jgi:SET domain-containing protein
MADSTANFDTVEYLNSTVFCALRPSPIHGIGVFAIRNIPKGTTLTDHTLECPNQQLYGLDEDDFARLHPEIRSLILSRLIFEADAPLIFLSPNTDAILRGFMNHSDTPNSDGAIALRDIAAGEEVTENYKAFGYKAHPLSLRHHDYL